MADQVDTTDQPGTMVQVDMKTDQAGMTVQVHSLVQLDMTDQAHSTKQAGMKNQAGMTDQIEISYQVDMTDQVGMMSQVDLTDQNHLQMFVATWRKLQLITVSSCISSCSLFYSSVGSENTGKERIG